jgi:hypothetical protein
VAAAAPAPTRARAQQYGRRDQADLISVKGLALSLPKKAWRKIRWREGSADWLSS